ncbi:transporter substrate-binding domain-containing protein [Shinella sp. NM-101]|uniref:transporter substrate-binding domain-containing protein n=1 Tax=Shinella sp. NM-101 TaxID=2744455 RepID=UPI001F1F7989|nr:transporter substrate-binding domain-containing protein [Shinella sp. NM-101]
MKKIVMALALAANLPLTPVHAADKLTEIKERGYMIVAVRNDSPRFGSINPENNEITGFDVDITNAIAEQILGENAKVEFVPVAQAGRIASVTTDRVDMVAATLSITNDRLREVDFSNVYIRVGQSLLVPQDSKVNDVNDLQDATVCAPLGSTPEMVIRNRLPKAQVLALNGDSEGLMAIKAGRCDAYSTGFLSLMDLAKADPSVRLAGKPFTYETFGLAFKKGDDSLREAVDAALTGIDKNGKYDDAYRKWIAETLPADREEWLGLPPTEAADRYAASLTSK